MKAKCVICGEEFEKRVANARLLRSEAVRNASPAARQWLTALLLHGEWARSDGKKSGGR